MSPRRIYYRILLAVLPTAEDYVSKAQTIVTGLDKLASRLERHLEEQAVALAKTARRRRLVVQAVVATFDRIEDRIVDEIGDASSHLNKAADARDNIAKLIAG